MLCVIRDFFSVKTGEANFDALEVNPLRSKKQRQETEVRSLLDKIPVEMISLDPSVLSEVDLPTLQQKWEAKRKILVIKPVFVYLFEFCYKTENPKKITSFV